MFERSSGDAAYFLCYFYHSFVCVLRVYAPCVMLLDAAASISARSAVVCVCRNQKASTEAVLSIVYQPQAVFRVRSVTRCTSSLPGLCACV